MTEPNLRPSGSSEHVWVRCTRCNNMTTVSSPMGMAPTPEIVRAVCERDPCPACGEMTMTPEDVDG